MRRDPTEFRERFKRWKAGERVYDSGQTLPAYDDGKTPEETYYGKRLPDVTIEAPKVNPYVYYDGFGNAATIDSNGRRVLHDARTFNPEGFIPLSSAADYENARLLLHKTTDPNHAYEFGNNVRDLVLNLITLPMYDAAFAGIGKAAGYGIKKGLGAIAASDLIPMQYVRYGLGKIYNLAKGKKVNLPTLYRKVKGLPKVSDGKVLFTNPNSRFSFVDGTQSPEITNMTTDMGVLAHSSGDWDNALMLATSGKKLLGKRVISTRPMDTFTYGDVLNIPVNDVSLVSGVPEELLFARLSGIKTVTDNALRKVYDAVVAGRKTIRQGRFSLTKENYAPYAKEMNNLARQTFGSPTVDDYKFMDYVFNPQYKSEVYPISENLELLILANSKVAELMSNAQNRGYILDRQRWGNVIYDPTPSVESQFRKSLGIDLKKHIGINDPRRYLGWDPTYDFIYNSSFKYK